MKLKRRILITIFIFIVAGVLSYLFFKEGILPVDRNDKQTKIFVVQKGTDVQTIANNLKREGLIRNKLVFYTIVKLQGIERNLQAGVFRLSPSMDLYTLTKELTHGSLDVSVTLIEGWRKEEIASELARNLDIPEVEFISKAREGFLFPDTYFIPRNSTVQTIINILTNNFNKRFQQAKEETIKKNELTDEEIVTLASLVEKEARYDEDRPKVANILLRRIDEGHKLQVDATVQYALGYQPGEKRWWKKETTFDDLEVDSTYNTYQNLGLPPAPIANAGLASIKAALAATGATPYLFYISDNSGQMHYARNSEEHQKNIDKYLK